MGKARQAASHSAFALKLLSGSWIAVKPLGDLPRGLAAIPADKGRSQ